MQKQNFLYRLRRPAFLFYLLALFSTALLAESSQPQSNNDIGLFAQAVKFSLQQQWSQAEPIYRELMARNNEWPEPANNLAVLLLKTNRIDEAKAVLEQAVISSPSFRIAQKNRSDLYNFLAAQAYDKALGAESSVSAPDLQLIDTVHQPVKVIEVEVEKIVIQKEIVQMTSVDDVAVTPKTGVIADPAAQSKTRMRERINQQLVAWSQAWSQGDFEKYIQLYSADFLPSDARKTYAEWKNIRRARLKFTKNVSIEIDKLRVFLDSQADYALVEFVQNYDSKSYSDMVLKQMYMGLQQGNWLILSERTIKIY